MQGLLHTILAGANVGILVLASAAFVLRLLAGRARGDLARGADLVAYAGIAAGTLLGVLTFLTGLLGTWPMAAIGGTVLAQNKVLVAVAMLAAYAMVWLLRWRAGPQLWDRAGLRAWATVLVVIGFVNLVLAGSMGGSAALKGTVLDPLLLATGINRYVSLVWGIWLNVVIIVLSVLFVAVSLVRAGRSRH